MGRSSLIGKPPAIPPGATVLRERYKQIRGLLRIAKERKPAYDRGTYYRRDFFKQNFGSTKGLGGKCRWCGLPTENKRLLWHTECLTAYKLSVADTQWAWKSEHGIVCCARCGKQTGRPVWEGGRRYGFEVDHIVPISVAWQRGWKPLIKALMLDNLQFLCRPCHVEKTRFDKAVLSNEKKKQQSFSF